MDDLKDWFLSSIEAVKGQVNQALPVVQQFLQKVKETVTGLGWDQAKVNESVQRWGEWASSEAGVPGVVIGRMIKRTIEKKADLIKQSKIVELDNGKWQVQSEKGKNMGTYDTEKEAQKRLKQIEDFKHKKSNRVNPMESPKTHKPYGVVLSNMDKTAGLQEWYTTFQETLHKLIGADNIEQAKEWVSRNWEQVKAKGQEWVDVITNHIQMLQPIEIAQELGAILASKKEAKGGYPNDTDRCRYCLWFNTDVTVDGQTGFFGRCATCINAFTEEEMKKMSKEDKDELKDFFEHRGSDLVNQTTYMQTKAQKKESMWKSKLQENYDSLEEFIQYSDTYGLAERLGYGSPEEAWEDNPMIQGGTDPSDFKKVTEKKGYWSKNISGSVYIEHEGEEYEIEYDGIISSDERSGRIRSWSADDSLDQNTVDEYEHVIMQEGIGRSKYVVNFHDGVKTHPDGSPFYDIRTFRNQTALNEFVQELTNDGYVEAKQEIYSKNEKGLKRKAMDEDDIEQGTKIEKEHEPTYKEIKKDVEEDGKLDTTLDDMAKDITEDHLDEHTDYYDDKKGLPAMEKRLEEKKKEVMLSSKDKNISKKAYAETLGEAIYDAAVSLLDFTIDSQRDDPESPFYEKEYPTIAFESYAEPVENEIENVIGSIDQKMQGKGSVEEMVEIADETVWLLMMGQVLGHGIDVFQNTELKKYLDEREITNEMLGMFAKSSLDSILLDQAYEMFDSVKEASLKKKADGGTTHPYYTVKCPKCGTEKDVTPADFVQKGNKAICDKCNVSMQTLDHKPKSTKQLVFKDMKFKENELQPNKDIDPIYEPNKKTTKKDKK